MRDINVTKYRKLLQELQWYCSDLKSLIGSGFERQRTDFERGYINGQHAAYKKVLQKLDKAIENADIYWECTRCREERWEKDEV